MRGLLGLIASGALLAAPVLAAALPSSDSLTFTIQPRDVWPPAAITDLAGSSGAEGQLMLQWTAPDSNNDAFSNKSPAAGYTLRIATFSAASVASTTTWWNMATDVASLPAPASPGVLESLLLQNLEPGATFYAAIKSFDAAGNVSPIDTKTAAAAQSFTLIYDAVPPAMTGLTVTGVSSRTISLSWTASAASDLWFYRLHVDSVTPYDFTDEYTIDVSSTSTSYVHSSLDVDRFYYYRVAAVDKGAPSYNGNPLEGPVSATVNAETGAAGLPMAPFGVGILFANNIATVTWLPVTALADGSPFIGLNATSSELTGYNVFRATAPIKAPWTEMIALSSNTLAWTDNASGAAYFYHVKSRNDSGFSAASIIRAYTGPAIVVGYDGLTTLQMPGSVADDSLNPQGQAASAYMLASSSRTEELGGRVLKSVELKAMLAGLTWDPMKHLTGMSVLQLHYDLADGQVVPGAAAADVVAATPDDLSVFWYNGVKYVQLYGTVDTTNQVMRVETPYLGHYQLRAAQRVGEFSFNPAGLSNKMVTPNGDGKNDDVVFTFDNPRNAGVTGRIFDVKGQFVADMKPGPIANSLLWDGRSQGIVVGSGVYLYQIEAEGRKFSGTVIIVK